MSEAAIRRELAREDPDLICQGLRRLTRWLGANSDDERPADFAERKAALTDQEPRLLALSSHTHDEVRELATDALGAYLGDAALQRLLALTEDGHERVRAAAVGALEGWPESKAAEELLLVSLTAGHWTVRMQAARALRMFRSQEAARTLLEGLVDPDSYVRFASAESLKRQATEHYLPRLRKLQQEYPAPHLLDAAIDLLGEVGTPEDAAFLAKVGSWINLSQPRFIRAWARKAAARIRARHAAR